MAHNAGEHPAKTLPNPAAFCKNGVSINCRWPMQLSLAEFVIRWKASSLTGRTPRVPASLAYEIRSKLLN